MIDLDKLAPWPDPWQYAWVSDPPGPMVLVPESVYCDLEYLKAWQRVALQRLAIYDRELNYDRLKGFAP